MRSEQNKENIQRFSWTEKKRFEDYSSASSFKTKLVEEGYEFIKIKRCGPGGTRFKVVTGSPAKTNKKTNNKKGNKNNAN